MAQSGYTAIQLYSSPTPGATPAATALTNGELALNAADGKLFYKDTAGNTQVIADSAFSAGVAIQGSGTSVVGTGTVQFANSNGVTFGLNGSTMTASVASGPSIQGSGTNVVNAGTVQFANSNGVTFGLNGSTMTASVSVAPNITFSAGTASIATGSVVFANSNGISFGLTSNTITAAQVLSSCAPSTQFTGYGFSSAVIPAGAGVFAPMTLTNSLAFEKAEHILNLAAIAGGRFTYTIGASTNLSNFNFGRTGSFYHNIYSKTGDTLSTQVNMTMTWSVGGAVSMSVATATNTNSYSWLITQSVTAVYPIGTSSNGLSYTTVSASSAFTPGNRQSTYTGTETVTFVPTFASVMDSPMVATMVNSAPTTLAPNTYWIGVGKATSSTAGTAVSVPAGIGGAIGGYTHYQAESNFLGAEALPSPGLLMNSVAANFTDYGMVPAVIAGANFTATYFKSIASGASVASYASTNAIFTQVGTTSVLVTDTAGGSTTVYTPAALYFPRITYL